VKNTGSRPGATIIQLYVSAPKSPTQRPLKELHGFEKVFLQPGEGKGVQIKIDEYATSFWDESEGKWCSEKGEYKIIVGTSSADFKSLEGLLVVEKTRWWLGL
jgi:beta-glucosidase